MKTNIELYHARTNRWIAILSSDAYNDVGFFNKDTDEVLSHVFATRPGESKMITINTSPLPDAVAHISYIGITEGSTNLRSYKVNTPSTSPHKEIILCSDLLWILELEEWPWDMYISLVEDDI